MILNIALVLLALTATGFVYRLIVGPSITDRALAVDGIVVTGLATIAITAIKTNNIAFLPVLVVITLVGFVSSSAAARFIEGQDR